MTYIDMTAYDDIRSITMTFWNTTQNTKRFKEKRDN